MNPTLQIDDERMLTLAAQVLEIESTQLLGVKAHLGPSFAQAVRRILEMSGRVVVTGMGKSGHVGRKIAATLASTGTPSMFVHPGEASHGDLGMITTADVVIALSNSGESEELNVIVPVIKRLGVTLIAITGGATSSLARHADLVLDSSVTQEACPLNLAPTASTTAQMALGDALAVALLDARGFRKDDFARSHPGGSLGRRLLVHVSDLMRSGDKLPIVAPDTPAIAMLREMSAKGLGFVAVASGDELVGIFTDGDLRREIEKGTDLLNRCAGDVLRRGPKTVTQDALAAEAATMMEQHRISSVLVGDAAGRLVGALSTNDLMRAKVI